MHLRLRNKLTLIIGALILTITLPLSYFSISETQKARVREARTFVTVMAKMVAQVELNGIMTGSRLPEDVLSAYIDDAFALNELFAYIVVVDNAGKFRAGRMNGKVIRIKGNDTGSTRDILENLAKEGQGLSPGLLVYVVDVNNGKQLLGRVKTAVTLKPLIVQLHRDICKYVAVTFILLGLGMVASNHLSLRISKPVGMLASAMKKVENGDLDINVKADRKDEIGDLADAFNSMALNLKKRSSDKKIKD